MIFSRKISHFMKVIEMGSYLKASESLYLTPSALRHSIYELEKVVSSKLFYRCGGGVVLTDHGRDLYESLHPIYHEANRVYNEFLQNNSTTKRCKVFLDGFYYPKVVDKLIKIQAELKKEIFVYQVNCDALDELKFGRCDIAISTFLNIDIPVTKNISSLFLSREQMGLLINKKAHGRYKDTHELLKNEKILHRSELLSHPILELICHKVRSYGMDYNVIGLPDVSDILETISCGNGITMISLESLKDRAYNKDILEFIPTPFPEPVIFERHMFFYTEYIHKFSQIAAILRHKG
ncbi:LysR family transcriptional regulator [Serratia sp. 3ACOL1]|jgi:DNA-binding transcriptional LysR family regulator|uniref:LysR family transcriptional regulator n=1 Tax=Serratia sp. 3ACOL1 TaxID=2448483 RepID=UPI000EF51333|nr:LysR family transcriptional regulator [Serratia sp. 3ACOL1]AYM92285.1 LysR family transcriptional regulator [Serratia sp. 3ACOL1]